MSVKNRTSSKSAVASSKSAMASCHSQRASVNIPKARLFVTKTSMKNRYKAIAPAALPT